MVAEEMKKIADWCSLMQWAQKLRLVFDLKPSIVAADGIQIFQISFPSLFLLRTCCWQFLSLYEFNTLFINDNVRNGDETYLCKLLLKCLCCLVVYFIYLQWMRTPTHTHTIWFRQNRSQRRQIIIIIIIMVWRKRTNKNKVDWCAIEALERVWASIDFTVGHYHYMHTAICIFLQKFSFAPFAPFKWVFFCNQLQTELFLRSKLACGVKFAAPLIFPYSRQSPVNKFN